ncbi:MAG: hypothetical protein KME46_24790 [Brasilonema angustatum HA4187-MV1]|nr:hypothetical protein [Brasilonema angustatum HA4187-MV1]
MAQQTIAGHDNTFSLCPNRQGGCYNSSILGKINPTSKHCWELFVSFCTRLRRTEETATIG